MKMNGLLRILLKYNVVLAAVLLVGCKATSSIELKDSNVFQPSASISLDLSESDRAASQPHTGHAVELAVVKAKGEGDQTLAAGQAPIIFNGAVFNAPQQIRNEFNMTYTSISWRWRKFIRESSIGLEIRAGVGHSSLGLNVSSASQSTSGNVSENGPQGAIGLIWRIASGSSVNLRVSGFTRGSFRFGRDELFFAQALGENVSLRAGYADWDIHNSEGSFGLNSSAFDIKFSGPEVSLGLNF